MLDFHELANCTKHDWTENASEISRFAARILVFENDADFQPLAVSHVGRERPKKKRKEEKRREMKMKMVHPQIRIYDNWVVETRYDAQSNWTFI